MKNNENTPIDLSKLNKTYFKSLPQVITWKYLVQLWRVVRKTVVPTHALHFRCEEDQSDYPELTNLPVTQAMVLFTTAVKRYEATDVFRDPIDAMRRESPLVINSMGVSNETQTLTQKNGYLEPYTEPEVVTRQVSDILACYTQYNQKLKIYTSVFTMDECKKAQIPYLDLLAERATLMIDDLDPTIVRTKIFNKLRHTAGFRWYYFYILQKILNHSDMVKYRTPANQEAIDWYTKCVMNKEPHFSFPVYYTFTCAGIDLYHQTLAVTWGYCLKSDSIRGITRGRGLFSVGYYMYPLASHYINYVSEARDILSVCNHHSIKALYMVDSRIVLASILAFNGLIIYCPGLSSIVQTDPKEKGIYGKILGPSVLYRALPPMPTLVGKQVKFQPEPDYAGQELRSSYLNESMKFCELFPSCRPADGIVMTFYDESIHSKCTVDERKAFSAKVKLLGERFSESVTYRNNFIFTRVPYCVRDKYSAVFPNCHYPRLTEKIQDVDETFKIVKETVCKTEPLVLKAANLGPMKSQYVPKVVFKPNKVAITNAHIDALYEEAEMDPKEPLEELHYVLHAAMNGHPHGGALLNITLTAHYKDLLLYLDNRILKDKVKEHEHLILFDYVEYKRDEWPYDPEGTYTEDIKFVPFDPDLEDYNEESTATEDEQEDLSIITAEDEEEPSTFGNVFNSTDAQYGEQDEERIDEEEDEEKKNDKKKAEIKSTKKKK